jgi:hypothetical protein
MLNLVKALTATLEKLNVFVIIDKSRLVSTKNWKTLGFPFPARQLHAPDSHLSLTRN